MRARIATLLLAAGVALGGCAYGGLSVGTGYGSPYCGWNDCYYYPGTGYYDYDRYRNSHRMTDAQRKYWDWRRKGSQTGSGVSSRIIQNWADFQNGGQSGTSVVRQRSVEPRTVRVRSEVRERGQRSRQDSRSSRSRSETRSSSSRGGDNSRRSSEDQ
jgi:hypothetical protein